MINLAAKHLKVALSHSAVKAIRFYLNSVCLRVTESGRAYLLATDGVRAFVGRIDAPMWASMPPKAPFDVLIPSDAVKSALKTREKIIRLTALSDGRYTLGATVFSAIAQGVKFPDINLILPTTLSGEPAHINPQYLLDAKNALNTWSGTNHQEFITQYNGNGASLIVGESCLVLVMPIRPNKVTRMPAFTIL